MKTKLIVTYLLMCSLSVRASSSFYLPNVEGRECYSFLMETTTSSPLILAYDSCQYEYGRILRDTERGRMAILDANVSIPYYMERFGKVMHHQISEESNPQLVILMMGCITDARATIQYTKETCARQRPYQYFGEHTLIPTQESPNDYTSYPSGHAVRAWIIALTLSMIDPNHAYDIMNVGYEIGQGRVISGFHYQSDVDAARLAADIAFARLCGTTDFQKQYVLAKEEYWESDIFIQPLPWNINRCIMLLLHWKWLSIVMGFVAGVVMSIFVAIFLIKRKA